jgi:hypothetical protein
MKSSKRSSQTDGGVWINSDGDEAMMNSYFYLSDYRYGPASRILKKPLEG